MKALIMSDSHGLVEEVQEVITRHRDAVDMIIHCGDSELDATHPLWEGVNIVKGNCDFGAFPEEWIETVHGCRLFITHGHLNRVKYSYVPLSYRAEEVGAQFVFFGHSHVATTFSENKVIYVNPGSLCSPRQTKKKTYCLFECNDNETIITFFEQDGSKINDWTKHFPANT